MTAGRGIVHSERTPAPERAAGHRLHGVQTWLALPLASEDAEPSFHHHDAGALPEDERDGVLLRVIAGTAFGMESPVRVYSPTLYVDARFAAGSRIALTSEHAERAVYPIDGVVTIDGKPLSPGHMHVLASGSEVELSAAAPARVLICGGAPLDGERLLWWNFVASTHERIERAKAEWAAQRLGQVPGETEFIPLPEA
jgi:redox-sensitive bicupin YhaK (pirin superfamily)